MRKKLCAVLLVLTMSLTMLPAAAVASSTEAPPFDDVSSSDWFYPGVKYMFEHGLMSGTGSGKFSPDVSTSRAMVVTMLHRLEGTPKASKSAGFLDVKTGSFYADAVDWAAEAGVFTGYSETEFGPDDVMTREQLATALYRYAAYKKYDVSKKADLGTYPDAGDVSSFAKEGMAWAVETGLVQGADDGKLSPAGSATRGQLATIFNRLVVNVVEPAQNGEKPGEQKPDDQEPDDEKPNDQKPGGGTGGGSGSGSGGGSGTGGNNGTAKYSVTVTAKRGDDTLGANKELTDGDVLTATVSPSATGYTVNWYVGGELRATNVTTYTVSRMDVGKEIYAELASDDTQLNGKQSKPLTVGSVSFTHDTSDKESPVSVSDNVTYKDNDGENVDIANKEVVITVSPSNFSGSSGDVKQGIDSAFTSVAGQSNSESVLEKIKYSSVKVNLIIKTSDENGIVTEIPIHPDGTVTVTLTKADLGISSDEDISKCAFYAYYNSTAVVGKYVTVSNNSIEAISFELPGIGDINFGYIPPLTVNFDTQGGTEVGSQTVKFGETVQGVITPTKEGSIFAGWTPSIDSNIYVDTTFKATWVDGRLVPFNRIIGKWKANGEDAGIPIDIPTPSEIDGFTIIYLKDDVAYSPNLSYSLTINGFEGVVKYVVSETAEGAVNGNNTVDVETSYPELTINVTDGNGNGVSGTKSVFIKWLDANDNTLGIESLTITVKVGYETKVETREIQVDRGFGQYTLAMIMPKESSQLNLAGYFDGFLSYDTDRNSSLPIPDKYSFLLHGSFTPLYYERTQYSCDMYKKFQLVVEPFDGDKFTSAPEVSAYYLPKNNSIEEPEHVDITNLEVSLSNDGKWIITGDTPPASAAVAGQLDAFMTLSYAGQEQNISFTLIYTHIYEPEPETEPGPEPNPPEQIEEQEFSNWNAAIAAVKSGTPTVSYTGEETAVLNEALTMKAGQSLNILNTSLIIEKDGAIIIEGYESDIDTSNILSSYINVSHSLTIKDGGIIKTQDTSKLITVAISSEEGDVKVEDSGVIDVSKNCDFTIYGNNVVFSEGSLVKCDGFLSFSMRTIFDGTMTGSGEIYIYYGEISKNGSLQLNSARIIFQTLINNGTIDLTNSMLSISEFFSNNSVLNLKENSECIVNIGWHSFSNTGAITVDDSSVLTGTNLQNTGSITGAGTLNLNLLIVEHEYDTGIEHYRAEEESKPDNYSRPVFTHDPSKTGEIKIIYPQISGPGTCTLKQKVSGPNNGKWYIIGSMAT